VVEELARRWGLRWGRDRFRARLAEGRAGTPAPGGVRGPRVALLLPQTHMNDAGRSVGPARGAFRLELDRVLVVHDEIDLPFGEVRARTGGGLAGHNGLKSLKRELGSGDYMRVRAGVGRPDSTDPEIVSAWVLGRFRESDAEVAELVDRTCAEVERIVLSDTGAGGS
jgi:PTH1 family peptidyl-tRNA hydrolase